MTQPHLLELAKQGDPQAIATLINATLEPQGVTAETFVEVDCLHVFLNAARPLNAQTLVAFVQRGILRLEVASIQQVQVYGKRLGEEQPHWVETFTVPRSSVAETSEIPFSAPESSPSAPDSNVPDSSTPDFNVSDFDSSDSSASDSSVTTDSFSDHSTQFDTWKQRWIKAKANIQALRSQNSQSQDSSSQDSPQPQAPSPRVLATWNDALQQISARLPWRDRSFPEAPNDSATSDRSVNYLKVSAIVTVVSFVAGGAVALIAHSYAWGGAERKAGEKISTISSSNQVSPQVKAERTRDQQQTAARNYLDTMNKAQQAFYRQNTRFAVTLEELERFAAVPIAVYSDYTYKLTVPNNNQAQLTAIPKAEGLKSYTAAVAIAKPTNKFVTAICASQQAAKVPPLVFQSTNGAVQCPADPAKAS
ncbi:type IV pilin-like G/H family protein [Leptolyngbya sp. FACHB-321]|uniref:type IV pilin-like G/H family protein n=1 Tax=Leptolyngbya sp. FACHB-321 TaxID=2692807 RepID=UPI001681CE99|nr:type IV pilin-like G/H family protein [Leptolyngbya sp. FACHB-321]MBD2038943.1 type IV pilin-like G/H family protein [Leptolyngbya sp. FACHB-321]